MFDDELENINTNNLKVLYDKNNKEHYRVFKLENKYFKTIDELLLSLNNCEQYKPISMIKIYDYYPVLCGEYDVIKETCLGHETYYTKNSRDSFLYLTNINSKNPYWDFSYGEIDKLYEPFIKEGITMIKPIFRETENVDMLVNKMVKSYGLSRINI